MDQRHLALSCLILLMGCQSRLPSHTAKPCAQNYRTLSMGSVFEIQWGAACAPTAHLYPKIQATLDHIESHLSLYQKHSELTQLNTYRELNSPSPLMLEMLQLGQKYFSMTGGRFNIASKSSVRKILIEPQRVRLLSPQMTITFDGIAKGYAVDKIYDLLQRAQIKDFLINFAGNMRWSGRNSQSQPWKVVALSYQLQTLQPVDTEKFQAIASSGETHQQNHIWDGRTQRTISRGGSVSAVCFNATDADVYSTTFFIDPKSKYSHCELH